jgi:iron complex outermembrane recepter protein
MKIDLRVAVLASIFATISTFAADQKPEQNAELEAIVVTGSRVISNGFAAPTPVTVLTADALAEKAPTSIPDALEQLPEFMGSSGITSAQVVEPTLTANGGTSNIGQGTYLNLYGLGSNRMLILQDGLRVPPNTSSGGTDANLFPEMLVQRVDVVTGGASAAYGSDAISGVVNFITDKKFEGVKGVLQGGESWAGDMGNYRIGLAGGIGLLDERLHLIGSAEQYHNGGIEKNSDRPWGAGYYAAGGEFGAFGPGGAVAGTAGNPYINYANSRFAIGNANNGEFNSGPLAGYSLVNGKPVLVNNGTLITPASCTNCPDNFEVQSADETLVPSITNNQFFGRAQYDINENLDVWTQASYARSHTFGNGAGASFFLGTITIFPNNAYLSPAARAILGNTQSVFSTNFSDTQVPLSTSDLVTSSLNISGGIEGKFSNGWRWDFTYANGTAKTDLYSSNQVSYPKAFAAFDAVVNPANGQIVCNVTLTNPGLYPGCAPFDLFGNNVASAAADAYIQGEYVAHDTTTEQSYEANLRGDLFSLWAGPVSAAIGAAYRQDENTLTSNSGTGSYTNTGIRGLGSTLDFVESNTEPSSGSRNVKEGYSEVFVPLAKDLPMVRALDLDAAVRETDYSTSGAVTTWKFGLNWQPVEDVRLRTTLSRDIRAPSLGELFAGDSRTINGPYTDPHTGGIVSVTTISGGNPNLQPEVSKTFTGGIVYTPSWLEGVHTSLDYFRFKISDAISQPYNAQQILNICQASNGTSPTCQLITRPLPYSNTTMANNATAVSLAEINVSSFDVNGVDFEVGYSHRLGPGEFDARLLAAYLIDYQEQEAPGQPVEVFAGNADAFGGLPKLKGSVQLKYSLGPWGLSVQERVVGSLVHSIMATSVYLDDELPAQFYTDLNATYDFEQAGLKWQTFFHVSNLFNRQAPLVVTSAFADRYPTLPNIYDVVGANFTAGVRFHF